MTRPCVRGATNCGGARRHVTSRHGTWDMAASPVASRHNASLAMMMMTMTVELFIVCRGPGPGSPLWHTVFIPSVNFTATPLLTHPLVGIKCFEKELKILATFHAKYC